MLLAADHLAAVLRRHFVPPVTLRGKSDTAHTHSSAIGFSFVRRKPTADLPPPVEVELARSTQRFPGLEIVEHSEEDIVDHDDDAHDLAKHGAGSVVPGGQS